MSVEMTKIACKVLQKFDGKPVSCYAVSSRKPFTKRSDLMIKAAIFDLDGTIGDTVESIAYSGNRASGISDTRHFRWKTINIMQVMA